MQQSTSPSPTHGPVWLTEAFVAFVVLALAVARGVVASETDLVADEAYYALWSLYPSPGYFDHPPAIAWLIALGRLLADNSFGVRAVALLTPVIISLALYRTGSIVADRGSALLAVLWYNLSVGLALSMLATPDVPSTLFWMLAAWGVAEFIRGRNANWWLVVGLFAGLGVLGKYTNLFFGAGIVLFLLTSRKRWHWLKLWQLWAGGLIAVLVVSPNLIWNARNGWITFAFQGGRIANDPAVPDIGANYLELLSAQIVFLGPLVVAFFLAATALFVARPRRWAALAWPVLSFLPALVYFAVHASRARVEANWLLPLWPMATLASAHVVLAGLNANLPLRFVRGLAIYTQTLLGIALTLVLQWIVFTHPPGLEHLDRTRDMRGWTEVARQLDAIADARNASWIAVPESYGVVGEFASYSQFIGAARPVIPTIDRRRYRFQPVEAGALPFPTVLVNATNSPEQLAAFFGSVEPLGTIERKFSDEIMATYQVFEVNRPTPAFFEAMR